VKDLLYIPVIITIWILIGCGEKNEAKKAISSKDYQWGAYYDDYFPDKKDSAFYLLNRVVNNSEDSIEKADAYFRMGRQQLFAGDHYSAQASFLSSIKILDEDDTAHHSTLAADYNALGNAALEVKDYQGAIDNYRLAAEFATSDDHKLYILNNLGVAYQKQRNYKRSASVFDSAARNNTLDTSIKAKIISNFARTKWLADPAYNPLPEFRYALTLRSLQNEKESVAINASFAYLSDYYEKTRPDSAYYYALKRLAVAKQLDDPGEKLEAFNQLINVGPVSQTKQYSNQYIELDDSISNARSKDRNQLALIRFDAEKNKADNLLLQKHITNQRLTIWGTVLLALLVIIALVVWARIRRNKLKQESENEIRASRLKTSQKVHDVVANGLYVIMNELEHSKSINREPLINKIEKLYERSRNISYEDVDPGNNIADQISFLLTAFSNKQTRVILVGNEESFWNRVSPHQKRQLQMVLTELMVNMKKHSRAKNVVIIFKQEDNTAIVTYNDDGIGFDPDYQFGNGLNNTVNRIKSLIGNITFGKNREGGVLVSISFPLESKRK